MDIVCCNEMSEWILYVATLNSYCICKRGNSIATITALGTTWVLTGKCSDISVWLNVIVSDNGDYV